MDRHLSGKKIIDINRIKQLEIPDIKVPKVKVNIPLPEQFISDRYELNIPGCASIALSFAVLVFAFFYKADGWMNIALFAAAFLLAGWGVFLSAFDCFIGGRIFCEELVCILLCIADAAAGNYADSASIMLGFRILRLIEKIIDRRIDGIVEELDICLPKKAVIETEAGYKKIALKKIRKNQIIVVKKGDTIPVDGIVIEGKSLVELYPLTGASESVSAEEGERVFSGSINMTGTLYIKAECPPAESEAAVLGNYIFDACTSTSSNESLIKKLGQIFFVVSSLAGVLLAIAVPLLSGGGWQKWIGRGMLISAMSFCFILVDTIGAAYISAIAVCTSHGIIVKKSGVLEKLAKTTTFIFNKTGTLTEKRYSIEEIYAENMSEYDLLSIAAVAEQYSSHPIARSICLACPNYERIDKSSFAMEEIPCRGVSVSVKGRHIFVGNSGLLEEYGVSCKMSRLGVTTVHVAVNGKYCGYIVLSNKIRENAFDAMEALRAQKISNMVMLTGDLQSISRRIASSLNMDMVKAELSTDEKCSVVQYLTDTNSSGNNVAYVCSGCEDEALFGAADVGIAIGALGNRAAEKSADVVVLKDDLEQLAECVGTASETMRKCLFNVIAFFSIKVLVMLFAAAGLFGTFPLIIADVAAAVFVMGNSFRILKTDSRISRESEKQNI